MELCRATARAKRSCADRGYVEDSFVQHFANVERSDPSINRGYYARTKALDSVIVGFGPDVQVVALGAGFDTSFWRLGVSYYEVDSETVVAAKAAVIARTPRLRTPLGEASFDQGVVSPRYKLIAADLRDAMQVKDRLMTAGLDPDAPTVFVCECVLAYLPPDASANLVAWTATFQDALLVDYDMMATDDAFGTIMKANFTRRNWPLLGAINTLDAHSARLSQHGFAHVLVADMYAVCQRLVLADADEQARVSKLEIFDDPDEFKLLMTHYCLALGGNGPNAAKVTASIRSCLS